MEEARGTASRGGSWRRALVVLSDLCALLLALLLCPSCCSVSEFHSEVSRTLSALGIDHAVEHLTDDQLFSSESVDVSFPHWVEGPGP